MSKALIDYIAEHAAWSKRTFGGDVRQAAILSSILAEIDEVRGAPTSDQALQAWVDIARHALDGAWRSGHTPFAVMQALVTAQTMDVTRRYPPLRMQEPVTGDGGRDDQ
jgi:hypothetical protein